ncbi:MAG TPA: GAF domain-containing protein, partial [Spirochaetes bacterium]|nr:GAF domain-containing protein [Spirochaetota bacterium]
MIGTGTLFDQNEESSNVHLAILHDVSQVINFSDNFQNTLDQIVSIVANRLKMDVCSIYLFNPEKNTLILQATKGLNVNSLGHVKLKLGEGVVSLAIEEMKAISIDDVQKHPRFLNFPEAEESAFNSFLGVPVIDSKNPIGVLVVQ